jgi:hypothetical protein
MKSRLITTALTLVLILAMVGGCGKGEEALDMKGLKIGKDLTSMLGEATKMLNGITDLESAKAALPQLEDMNTDLGGIISKVSGLSAESKDSLAGMVKGALPALEGAIGKISANQEIGQTLMPTLNSMLDKVKGLI